MVTKRIIVLADSYKHGGRCIAGVEIPGNGSNVWIRPVSDREGEAISDRERTYADGTLCTYFDVVDIDFLEPTPHKCHTENWLIDSRTQWRKVGSIGFSDLSELIDTGLRLWLNGRKTWAGLNDEMTEGDSDGYDYSIGLIRVPRATVILETSERYNSRSVRVDFFYNLARYRLKLTDVAAKSWFLVNKRDGSYRCDDCFLTISLSEPTDKTGSEINFRYKLVAGFRCAEIAG